MLGDLISEVKGKRIVRRVISANPLRVEVTFEESGTLLGVGSSGFGTYTSDASPDGSLYGEGNGAIVTADGDAITWHGAGAGRLLPGGAVSYRGMLFFRTASAKMARLNNACGAFEYEVDASGNTQTKIWEWK